LCYCHAISCVYGIQEVRGFLCTGGWHYHGYPQRFQQGAPLLHCCHSHWRIDDWGDRHIQRIILGIRVITDLYISGGFDSPNIDLVVPEAWD